MHALQPSRRLPARAAALFRAAAAVARGTRFGELGTAHAALWRKEHTTMTRLALALAAALALNAGCPREVSAQTSDPNHEIGEPLWMAGLSVFAATYVITGVTTTVLRALTDSRQEVTWQAWVPLAGPFIMLADSAGFDSTQYALTVVSAILQVLGCAAMITGIVLDAQPDPVAASSASLSLVPSVSQNYAGLSLSGRF
jgi:hypothetical protein